MARGRAEPKAASLMRRDVGQRFMAFALALLLAASPAIARGHATPAKPALNAQALQAEVLLARAGFSPGAIDARDGDNFANALHAFQQAQGLPVGALDATTLAALTQQSP